MIRRKLFSVIFLVSLSLIIFFFNLVRMSSNIEFLFNNDGALLVPTTTIGFESISNSSGKLNINLEYENQNVSIHNLKYQRENESIIHRIENFINPNKLLIFEFNTNNEFSLYANVNNNLSPTNSSKALKNSKSNFAINTNFYGKTNKIEGELIIDGERYGNKSNGSGFFKVIDGKPIVGAKSLFANLRGKIEYSCQAFPSVMKNGYIWDYITSDIKTYSRLWEKKTYRNLIGTKPNGNLVFIVSNNGALLSVKEISLIAKKLGVNNASLFDGGAALQYKFNSPGYNTSFSAFNNTFSLGQRIDELILKYSGITFEQKSPVFLTVRCLE